MSTMIHKKMIEVMKTISPIEKKQKNKHQDYQFRGIDDVFNALNKPLADAGVFFIPEVVEATSESFPTANGKMSFRVRLRVKYTFFAEDGSSVCSVASGEAVDTSDKATNKAMQAALKYMLLQVFCIPTQDMDDADEQSPQIDATNEPKNVQPVPNKPPANKPPIGLPKSGSGPKTAQVEAHCERCDGILRLSRDGKSYYCPNYQDNANGKHTIFKKEALQSFLDHRTQPNGAAHGPASGPA